MICLYLSASSTFRPLPLSEMNTPILSSIATLCCFNGGVEGELGGEESLESGVGLGDQGGEESLKSGGGLAGDQGGEESLKSGGGLGDLAGEESWESGGRLGDLSGDILVSTFLLDVL